MDTNRTKEITRRLDEIVNSRLEKEPEWLRKEKWEEPSNPCFRNITIWGLNYGECKGTGLMFTDFGKAITSQGIAVGTKEAEAYKKIPNSEVIQGKGWYSNVFDVKLSGRYEIIGDRSITEEYGDSIDALFDDLNKAVAYYERIFERVPKRRE